MTKAKRDAFLEGINSGKFNSIRARIYRRFDDSNSLTITDFEAMGIPHKTASGRISELLNMGLICESGFTERGQSKFIKVLDEAKQDELIEERGLDRYKRWYKVGKENGWL